MTGVLARHLGRMFLGRWLAALLGLSLLLGLLDLLDNATDVLSRGGGAGGVLFYAAIRLPMSAERLVPMAALVAALLVFARLAAGSEAATLRALGVGGAGMFRALLPACLLVSALGFALADQASPRAQRVFADWWATLPRAEPPPADARTWFRAGRDVASAHAATEAGRRLESVILVRRDARGVATARIDAAAAEHGAEGWVLRGVREAGTAGAPPRALDALPWPDAPSPANLRELFRPVEGSSIARINAVLDGRWVGTRGEAALRTERLGRIAALLSPFVMVLLALPATLALPRRGGPPVLAGAGLLLGLGHVALAGGTAAMGQAGVLSPAMAAFAAPVLFGCLGVVLLLQLEG